MEPDDETGFLEHPSRARRAKAIAAVSVAVIAIACVVYLRPSFSLGAPRVQSAPQVATGYKLDAIDFVDASTGWVLADLDNSQFTVIGTTNAGRSWQTRLVAPSTRPAQYMQFFDHRTGVVVALGPDPTVYVTRDGGAHWASRSLAGTGYVIAASFVDADHGWLLRYGPGSAGTGATELLATTDGGNAWRNLHSPVGPDAQAFAIAFANRTTGWLDSVASGPFAYTTSDGGSTWHRATLPEPTAGWPAPRGSFFVAARPTLGSGVVVMVVNSLHINGRNAAGSAVISYPPLTVRTFDGGSPVEYVYSTFVDTATDGVLRVSGADYKPGPVTSQVQAAGQLGFRSTDGGETWLPFAPPAPGGTIGYANATEWWWVGSGLSSQTTDAGKSWSPSRPDPVVNPVPGSLIVLDSEHAWLSALDDQGPVLFTTTDGGGFWNEVRLPHIAA